MNDYTREFDFRSIVPHHSVLFVAYVCLSRVTKLDCGVAGFAVENSSIVEIRGDCLHSTTLRFSGMRLGKIFNEINPAAKKPLFGKLFLK